jgi:hypothetical protein
VLTTSCACWAHSHVCFGAVHRCVCGVHKYTCAQSWENSAQLYVGVLETSVFTRSAPPLLLPWSRYNREGDLLFTAAKDAVSPGSRTFYQRATGLGPSLPALSYGERRDE